MKKKNVGFTLVELLAVLVILALLILLAGSSVIKLINGLDKEDSELSAAKIKTIENAAEKWSLDNLDKFDDEDAKTIEVGLDIIFLIDASGGMRSGAMPGSPTIGKSKALVDSTNIVLQSLQGNPLNRIGFVFFGGTGTASKFGRDSNIDTIALMDAENVTITYNPISYGSMTSALNLTVNKNGKAVEVVNMGTGAAAKLVEFSKATNTILGIQYATEMLLNSPKEETRIPVIIMLTDGEPSVGKTGAMDISDFTKLTGVDWGAGGTTWCLGGSTWDVPANTPFDASAGESISYPRSFCSVVSNTLVTKELNGKGVAYINQKSAGMYWNTIARAASAKQEISKAYNNSNVFFYTIGIGLTSDLGKFVVDPSESYLNSMSSTSADRCTKIKKAGGVCDSSNNYDNATNKNYKYYDHLWHVEIEEQLYNLIMSRNDSSSQYYSIYSEYSYPEIKDYYYPTEAFTDSDMTADRLKEIFSSISQNIIDATKVSTVCVTLQELLEQGYLTDNVTEKFDNIAEEYVLIQSNDATHQYAYTYVTTQKQRETCNDYFK